MDTLWAPWRMEYIRRVVGKMEACIFCPMLELGDDRERLILARGRQSFVVLNRYPYNTGHLLIVPHQHGERLGDVPPSAWAEVMELAGASVEILRETVQAAGANIGLNLGRVAGAGIADHCHLHVVPRWVGDFNFLPVLAATKSMPEYLLETYDKLRPAFVKLEKREGK
ncbi:MAG: HIT domain-containing protein [Deltaproteobacteria bacterium]|nr:HIT domain-containing protein [Deltaproteobacteria bacterium]